MHHRDGMWHPSTVALSIGPNPEVFGNVYDIPFEGIFDDAGYCLHRWRSGTGGCELFHSARAGLAAALLV